MREDIKHLANTRAFHSVPISLWQNTEERRRTVASIDFGNYLDLKLQVPTRGIDIDAVVLVTSRSLTFGSDRVPTVNLTCLETGLVIVSGVPDGAWLTDEMQWQTDERTWVTV